MSRRLVPLAALVTAVVSLSLGWVLAAALRPAPAAPVAPIEMPSGATVVTPEGEPSQGAVPIGPRPSSAGSVTAPAEPRADGAGTGDSDDDEERDEDGDNDGGSGDGDRENGGDGDGDGGDGDD